jgi:chromosome segregation ATPase
MSSSARVFSLDALVDLKAALCIFTAEAREALSAVEMEIRRNQVWLDGQLKYWQDMVRQCEDQVFQARQELTRRKMMRIGDRPPDTSEQEEALQLAQARLAHAEEKVEKTRRWLRLLPEAIIEYEGPARQLSGILEADMPKADALLESKIAALEAYVQLLGSSQSEGVSSAKVAPTLEEKAPAPPSEVK